MKKLLNLIPIVFIIFFNSCDSKKKENNIGNNDLKSLLEKQIKAGYAAEKSETDYLNYNFSEIDLNLSNEVLKEYLVKNGYKIPSNKAFNEIINKTFQRNLDYSSSKKNIYINFTNPCNREIKFLKNNSEELHDYSFYINKDGNFITELFSIPEVLDYQKVFPEIATYENSLPASTDDIKIYKWNSLENLSQIRERNLKIILSRNKFLFNNNRADLIWLLNNDKNFLIELVVKFGFDKEKQINKLVLEELYKNYENQTPTQIEKLGNLFFFKNCNNTFSISYGLLEYVRENTNEKDNRFIYALDDYSYSLYGENLDKIYGNDNPAKIFNAIEKANILAIIASIEIPAIEKYKQENPELWNNAGSSLYNLLVAHPEIEDIIIKQNYFGIKNMKMVLEDTVNEIEADNIKRNNN